MSNYERQLMRFRCFAGNDDIQLIVMITLQYYPQYWGENDINICGGSFILVPKMNAFRGHKMRRKKCRRSCKKNPILQISISHTIRNQPNIQFLNFKQSTVEIIFRQISSTWQGTKIRNEIIGIIWKLNPYVNILYQNLCFWDFSFT